MAVRSWIIVDEATKNITGRTQIPDKSNYIPKAGPGQRVIQVPNEFYEQIMLDPRTWDVVDEERVPPGRITDLLDKFVDERRTFKKGAVRLGSPEGTT